MPGKTAVMHEHTDFPGAASMRPQRNAGENAGMQSILRTFPNALQ